ncbi:MULTISPECIES: nuclear transport factor 2 family protein [Clostridium]|uniref:Nuclear transport factor 2 family protein n=1 Tax=Clostridium cibarium TaxID=2762247 RepID=A0ABR8PX83_9CLOT|nr:MULTISPECIES: nuclear transport factor 2 family protein [Clostridium]MBD7912786.1 nuclear transport factor 2 family protein [Clostridium cibarium]
MKEREQVIKNYFQSWISNDCKILREIFDTEIIYSECYGPEYRGIEVVTKWFKDWHKRGVVFSWDIKQFIHSANITVVEWYFKYKYDESIEEFNGVSLIEFDEGKRIISLKEFQSKIPHYYPYD